MATTIFSVIGEHRNEPHRLLLLGDDGQYYAFTSSTSQPTVVEPGEDWEIDAEQHGPADAWTSPDQE